MEEKKKIKCTKCQKEVLEEKAFKTKKGVVCEDCHKKIVKRKRIIIGSSFVVALTGVIAATTLSTSNIKTGIGFDGVSDIRDSVVLKTSLEDTKFDISTAVVQSSTVSMEQTVSDLESFNLALAKNISDAEKTKGNKFKIPTLGVLFEINTNYFIPESQNVVEEFAKTYLQTNKQATILIEGYTCDLGTDNINNNLSRARAEAVKEILEKKGVPSDKIEIKWYGKSRYGDFKYSDKSEYRRVIVSIK